MDRTLRVPEALTKPAESFWSKVHQSFSWKRTAREIMCPDLRPSQAQPEQGRDQGARTSCRLQRLSPPLRGDKRGVATAGSEVSFIARWAALAPNRLVTSENGPSSAPAVSSIQRCLAARCYLACLVRATSTVC